MSKPAMPFPKPNDTLESVGVDESGANLGWRYVDPSLQGGAVYCSPGQVPRYAIWFANNGVYCSALGNGRIPRVELQFKGSDWTVITRDKDGVPRWLVRIDDDGQPHAYPWEESE